MQQQFFFSKKEEKWAKVASWYNKHTYVFIKQDCIPNEEMGFFRNGEAVTITYFMLSS
jgi:hypothetical protein